MGLRLPHYDCQVANIYDILATFFCVVERMFLMKNNVTAFKSVGYSQKPLKKSNNCKAELLKQEKIISQMLNKNKSLFSELNRLLLEEYHYQKSIDFYNEGYLSAITFVKQSLRKPFIFNRVISELFSMYYAHLFSVADKKSMENSLFLINSHDSFYSFCSSFEGKNEMQKRCTQIQLLYNKISSLIKDKGTIFHDYIIMHRKIYKIDTERLFLEGYMSYLNRLFAVTLNKLS